MIYYTHTRIRGLNMLMIYENLSNILGFFSWSQNGESRTQPTSISWNKRKGILWPPRIWPWSLAQVLGETGHAGRNLLWGDIFCRKVQSNSKIRWDSRMIQDVSNFCWGLRGSVEDGRTNHENQSPAITSFLSVARWHHSHGENGSVLPTPFLASIQIYEPLLKNLFHGIS